MFPAGIYYVQTRGFANLDENIGRDIFVLAELGELPG